MKNKKKETEIATALHIHGDLSDARHLIAKVCRKKTVMVYRNGEDGSLYLGDSEDEQHSAEEIATMSKSRRLIFADFFPSKKEAVPPVLEIAELPSTKEEEKKSPAKKRAVKSEKVKTDKKGKKQKSGKK